MEKKPPSVAPVLASIALMLAIIALLIGAYATAYQYYPLEERFVDGTTGVVCRTYESYWTALAFLPAALFDGILTGRHVYVTTLDAP
jgi:hypothetical protein